jgi:hypothetical protein
MTGAHEVAQHRAVLIHRVQSLDNDADERLAVFIADATRDHAAALEKHVDTVDCAAGRKVNWNDGCSRKPRLRGSDQISAGRDALERVPTVTIRLDTRRRHVRLEYFKRWQKRDARPTDHGPLAAYTHVTRDSRRVRRIPIQCRTTVGASSQREDDEQGHGRLSVNPIQLDTDLLRPAASIDRIGVTHAATHFAFDTPAYSATRWL